MDNQDQLKKLAKIFNIDKVVTAEDLTQVLEGVLGIMNSFKKDNESLNTETKQIVNDLLLKVKNESEKIGANFSEQADQVKTEINSKLKEAQAFLKEVKKIKAIPGKDGLDALPADEEKIIAEVMGRIKLPTYKETMLDDAGQIADKLETLTGDKRLSATAIKDLPEFIQRIPNGGGWRNLFQLHDTNIVSPTNGQVIQYNSTTGRWENASAAGTGTVTSVATDATLTGGPITTTGTLGINLSNANTWLAKQSFGTGLLKAIDVQGTNSHVVAAFTDVASAVNYIALVNAATGSPSTVKIQALGTDSNINILVYGKGTGLFGILDPNNSWKALFQTSSLSADRTFTLPNATDTLIGKATTDVFTNKTLIATSNVVEEITTTTSSATPTPTGGSLRNFFTVTALAAGATFAAPSGSPVDGNYLTIRVLDNGTARSLAFNAIYRFSSDLAAPTTTVISKTLYMGFRYNGAASKWDCLAILNNL